MKITAFYLDSVHDINIHVLYASTMSLSYQVVKILNK